MVSSPIFFHKYNMENNINEYFIRTSSDKLDKVKNDHPEAILIHLHDENEDNLYVGDCRVTDNFNIGELPEDIKTNLGDKTLGELKDKSISEIVIDMICPLEIPKVKTNPSISISGVNTLIKVGDPLPNLNDVKVTPDRGLFTNGMTYAGEYNNDTSLVIEPGNFGEQCDEGIYIISGYGSFGEGVVPKDTRGNLHEELQYKGGSVSTNKKITVLYPIYVNSYDITNVDTELELKDYNSEQSWFVSIPAEIDDSNYKFKIKLPYEFSSMNVFQENPTKENVYDIPIEMSLFDEENHIYIRTLDPKDTITDIAKYEIKLKK